jgi:uncharacterized Zn finger protein
MSNIFLTHNYVQCPNCKEQDFYKNLPIEKYGMIPKLKCIDRNYSGCGVDMAECGTCGQVFEVSYSIDKVVRVPAWENHDETA